MAGAKTGHFVDAKKNQIPFIELFSAGQLIAQDSIQKFCELFNLIGYEYLKGTVDIRLFYFEYGQYLSTVHYWVSYVDSDSQFFKTHYPYFYKMYRKNEKKFSNLPYKTIAHLE
jgi:hypothetical protein